MPGSTRSSARTRSDLRLLRFAGGDRDRAGQTRLRRVHVQPAKRRGNLADDSRDSAASSASRTTPKPSRVSCERGLDDIRRSATELPRRPRVYFEEWDDPLISGIQWVEELIEIAGGDPVFPDMRRAKLARDRIVSSEQVMACRSRNHRRVMKFYGSTVPESGFTFCGVQRSKIRST